MAGAIFAAVALVFVVVVVPLALRDRSLARNGTLASATVVGRRAETRRGDGGAGDVRAHVLEYEFPLADGRTWAAERAVDAGVWNTVDVGDRLDVRYDPGAPARHVLPGTGASVVPIVGALFPLLFLGIGVLLVRRGLPDILEPVRLYRSGIVASARITGAEEITNLSVNGRHPVRIRYAFRDRDGRPQEGATSTMDRALLERLSRDAATTVLYAPDDPRRSVLLAALGLHATPGERGGTTAAFR